MAARGERPPRQPHPARRHPHRPRLRGARRDRGREERRIRLTLYRVFPWSASALPGERFSAAYVPPAQGSGRFDLPGRAVWYLAESPVHAVAEALQGFRSRPFHEGMLRRFGHALALVQAELPDDVAAAIVDLDDPAELLRLGLAPSLLASDDRARTQAAAARVHATGAAGLRWWSRLSGDWHGVVLFLDRSPVRRLTLGPPEPLVPAHPAVVSACRQLAMRL